MAAVVVGTPEVQMLAACLRIHHCQRYMPYCDPSTSFRMVHRPHISCFSATEAILYANEPMLCGLLTESLTFSIWVC